VAVLPAIAFLAVRLRYGGWRGLVIHRGPPIAGVTLAEAVLWLLSPAASYVTGTILEAGGGR